MSYNGFMLKFLPKVAPVLILWGTLIYVVLQVPYPNSLTSATLFQFIAFFIPLFLALTLTINLFFKFILSGASISLGIIFMFLLKALDILNFVSAGLTITAVVLLLSYFRKVKRRGLTKLPKISKLTSLRRKNE